MSPNLPLYWKTLEGKTYVLLMSYTQNSGKLTFFWRLGERGRIDFYGYPKVEGGMVTFDQEYPEIIKKWATKIILKPQFR